MTEFCVALAYSELPLALIDRHGLAERVHDRGGEREVRFNWRAAPALLPVWRGCRLQVVRWGNRDRAEGRLPAAGMTWEERVESGWWAQLAPEDVFVPASAVMANGVWFKDKQGVQALLVRDRRGEPVAFPVVRPPTRYYEIMCRTDWMPVFVGEVI